MTQFAYTQIWPHFPEPSVAGEIVNLAYDNYGKGEVSPYHFTLYVMFGIYSHLQRDVKFKFESGIEAGYACVADLGKIVGSKIVPNPNSKDEAHSVPLRAIAYFTWERERRVFLTRRVYPTNFGFLSYSHVPEGWGALGLMLDELNERRDKYEQEVVYTCVKDIRDHKTLIPYLSEKQYLDYESVLVLPVFKQEDSPPSLDNPNLLGAFAFYIKKSSCLPYSSNSEETIELKNRFKSFAVAVKEKITAHETGLNKNREPLAQIIKKDYKRLSEIGELTITSYTNTGVELLDKVTALVLKDFSGTDYFSVLDKCEDNSRTILIVCREGIKKGAFEARVLSAVGVVIGNIYKDNERFKGQQFVSYWFKFLG